NKNISSKDVGCQHLAAHVAIFASINRHQPGGEIGQTRFVCPGRGRATALSFKNALNFQYP
ncbi:MAG: hypothetical protein SOZ50_04875, partial [Sodaliphilus sp.]|nr:hypothetical protein [Sodaliphilus sp.]